MTSSDNAHVHTYTGTLQNPAINTGYWGQTGSKLKPGDILEIDSAVSVERGVGQSPTVGLTLTPRSLWPINHKQSRVIGID
jgi:hypothetical protein